MSVPKVTGKAETPQGDGNDDSFDAALDDLILDYAIEGFSTDMLTDALDQKDDDDE
jgi:hypothetical protein